MNPCVGLDVGRSREEAVDDVTVGAQDSVGGFGRCLHPGN